MAEVLELTNKISTVKKAIKDKQKEVEKRREVIETVSSTYVSRKKDEAKIEAIDTKISQKVAGIDKTIDYYKKEIEQAERKFSDDSELLRKKLETEITKLENKFTAYRLYCQEAIRGQEEKRDLLTEPLEKKKELLEQTREKSEEDDKVLVRLKIEMKQLLDEEKELQERWSDACKEEEDKQERRRKQAQAEAEEKMNEIRRQEAYDRERQLEIVASQRAAEKAADEERWARQREERKQTYDKEKEKDKQKEEAKTYRHRFLTQFYPSLSEKAGKIYDFFKNSSDPEIYKEAMKKETLGECEDYLLEYEETYDLITDFETTRYSKLMKDLRDEFDNMSPWEQVRFIKQQEKKKDSKPLMKSSKQPTLIPLESLGVFRP